MEIKVFGKSLFEFRTKKSDMLWLAANSANTTSKYLPDFFKSRGSDNFIAIQELSNTFLNTPQTISGTVGSVTAKKPEPKKEDSSKHLTPKEVHELKMLHDDSFKLNVDPAYVDEQLVGFKDKLGLIKAEEYDMRNGAGEIGSIITRLENRKKYPEFKEFFDDFAYTTTTKIDALVKAHDYLQIGQVAQFLADMPNEAVKTMKDYDWNTDRLCGKKAVFYIIADKKDFKQTNSRRDPILLAQSPFGHFWQILGAWDKEMMFLEDL